MFLSSTLSFFFFFNDTATTEIYTLSLHDALPIYERHRRLRADDPSPLAAIILGVVDGLQLQRIERAANGLQPLQRHPQIPGGGPDVGMSEQHLDGAEIGAGIQHVRGARMPEQVGINRASDTGPLSSVAAQHTKRCGIKRLIMMLFGREQPVGPPAPAK